MVCSRCILVVRQLLEGLGHTLISVELGKVEVEGIPTKSQLAEVDKSLQKVGFELLDDKRSQTVERIKTLLIELVQADELSKLKLSEYLGKTLAQDYSALSRLFTESQGTTIEQYYIHQRIERAKELLVYNELSLSQIAHQLHYSSVAHLSRQFKQITGLTPSQFKKIGHRRLRDKL